ncbi:hypothetical protein F5Y06DRAFT_305652 [Hypoxylon sp. FL0890]|nr:hypothetical protein F5Y06DRAFT_305652 [Hypoxylon sp. FL0890]
MPSQHPVLVIPEIVEIFLGCLTLSDLFFRARFVCKNWKEAIERSPKLKEIIFLRAISEEHLHAGTRYIHNPLLFRVLPSLFQRFLAGSKPTILAREGHYIRKREIDRFIDHDQSYGYRFTTNGSWRDMQLSQPKITKLLWSFRAAGNIAAVAEFKFPEGLRMGVLVDLLMTTKGDCKILWPAHWFPVTGRIFPESLCACMGGYKRLITTDRLGAVVINNTTHDHVIPGRLDQCIRDRVNRFEHLLPYRKNLRRLTIRDKDKVKGGFRWRESVVAGNTTAAMQMFIFLTKERPFHF